jgi:hypothetical protein
MNDIEGKAPRGAATERGQRRSFKTGIQSGVSKFTAEVAEFTEAKLKE